MILLFLLHILITGICAATGIQFYSLLFQEREAGKSPIYFIITGLVIIMTICQICALFVPVNGFLFIGFLTTLFIACLARRRHLKSYWRNVLTRLRNVPHLFFLTIGACWLMILTFSAGPTLMDDTESYHIQMVKWLHEYGTVPGIANLH